MSIIRKNAKDSRTTSTEVVYIDSAALVEMIAADLGIPVNEIDVEFQTDGYNFCSGAEITITKRT